jgi:hypothetical protein
MKRILVFISALLGLSAAGFTAIVPALADSKDLQVVPSNSNQTIKLTIAIDKPTVALGETVAFSFSGNEDGFVTLWNLGTSGKVVRIFPNTLGGDMRVKAGLNYGAGGAGDKFAFRASGQTGMEDVYLVWTRTPEAQPADSGFLNPEALSKDLAVVENLPSQDWATAKITYEIVPAVNSRALTVPFGLPTRSIATAGNVYIVAMGANVGSLTKTNADATRFVGVMGKLFDVPAANTRLLPDARKADFEAAMLWLREQAKPEDTVLIFFSGHGSRVPDDDGDEADGWDEGFVMFDAQESGYARVRHLVRDDQFAGWLAALQSEHIISVIDACFSSGLARSMVHARTKYYIGGELGEWAETAQKSLNNTGTPAPAADGFDELKGLVYAAADENQYALEVQDGALFTTRLLEQVNHAGGEDFRAIFDQTRAIVERESQGQQTPAILGNAILASQLRLQ